MVSIGHRSCDDRALALTRWPCILSGPFIGLPILAGIEAIFGSFGVVAILLLLVVV
jgi:hypothetical protein